ncbi:MAG: extracellular solute-binding protein [Clostridia bacterium]|nr:extracellular solute-binding protein [Clostridia bacterium]
MKRIISLILALAMIASLAVAFSGCDGGNQAKNDGKFTVYGFGNYAAAQGKEDLVKEYESRWMERCEYPIEPINGDIQMIMASGDYPDIIPFAMFDDYTISKYAAQGIFVALDEYISEENTPNIWKMFQEQPSAKAISTNPDGHIYSLPLYTGNETNFLETYWWINDAWLKKLGLETPTTIPELTEVLRAFKTGDPNGNGKADEIPFSFSNTSSAAFPETLLSCWGVSTKFGIYGNYLNVKDGEVRFAPMMDEWKEMIKTYAMWYKEGLLDIECISQEDNVWQSKLTAVPPVIGCAFYTEQNPFKGATDEYKIIAPLSADGTIKPQVRLHPGLLGVKNEAFITSACEDPAAAMRWLDTFYDKDETIVNWYGNVGEDGTFTYEDGMYKWNDPAAQGYNSLSEMYYGNSLIGPHIRGYLDFKTDYGTLIEKHPEFQASQDLYDMYRPYLEEEVWPSPFCGPDDATKIANLQTDIFNAVEVNKADWILGRSDVEEDWDKYLKEMKSIGIEDYVNIMQKSYDSFKKALDEATK